MKTALSLAAALALGCASAALAQSERYGSPYDQPNGQSQDQNSQGQNDQYGPQNDQYQNEQNPNAPSGRTTPGYGSAPNSQYNQNGQYEQNQNGQYNGRYDDENNGGYNNGSGTSPSNLDRDEVRDLQLRLRHEGYDPGRADGSWGQQTASALADFQRANGIEPTGNLDKRTARALGLPPDEGYGSERSNSYDRFESGRYGNELNNPDTDENNDMNNSNNPGTSPQDPNTQNYPH